MAAYPSYSALDFITRALRLINVIGVDETPSSEDSDDGFDTLNELLDSWAAERSTIYAILRTVQILTSGTASYTIGTGGTINLVRPEWIQDVGLILDTGAATLTEVGRRQFSDQEWAGIAQKTLQSRLIQGVWFDRTWTAGLGRIYPWPIPNVGTTQLVLYTPTAVVAFATLATEVTFPPGYPRAIRSNLALELATAYNVTPSPRLVKMAVESLATIKRANWRPSTAQIDVIPSDRRGTWSQSQFLRG